MRQNNLIYNVIVTILTILKPLVIFSAIDQTAKDGAGEGTD